LAIFIDGQEATWSASTSVDSGKWLGRKDPKAEKAGVRIENVDAALESSGGWSGGRGAVRKRL